MGVNSDHYRREYRRFLRAQRNFGETEIPKEAIDHGNRLARGTPRDTGYHGASWNTQVGSPNRSTKEYIRQPNLHSLQDRIVNVSGFTLGQSIWNSNHARAIRLLEAGHSQQAPAGWIAPTNELTREILRRRGAIR